MPRAKDTDPITGYIMVPERPRRNLTYGQPADTMSTKKDYGDWLQGHIMRSKTRVKYAKELGDRKSVV